MQFKQLASNLSVAEQISVQDVQAIAASGFRSIICNRPDGEGPDQPAFADIETAAKARGLAAAYLPVISGQVTQQDAESFATLVASLPAPVLAYCRTGTRSTTLWSLTKAQAVT